MVTLNLRSLTEPVGALRILEVVLTCISFSLAASAGHNSSSYWAWSMFTWCFCCFFTLFILIMELTSLSAKVPISWDDFTTAFAMLATLMCLAASVIYPAFFTCPTCSRQIVATVVSLLCFGAYVGEVALTRFRPGEVSGFLSTVPGLLKILETFVACIIFTSLDPAQYHSPGLQWCVAAYSICFIFALLIVLLTIGQLLSVFPFGFEKLVIVYNGLAAFMYMTATVIWPLYSFENNPRPNPCLGRPCLWDNLVVVSFMTAINTAVYIMDTVYSVNVVFFTPIE